MSTVLLSAWTSCLLPWAGKATLLSLAWNWQWIWALDQASISLGHRQKTMITQLLLQSDWMNDWFAHSAGFKGPIYIAEMSWHEGCSLICFIATTLKMSGTKKKRTTKENQDCLTYLVKNNEFLGNLYMRQWNSSLTTPVLIFNTWFCVIIFVVL